MPAQDLLTNLKAMTKDQLIEEVTKREEMIFEMQAKQLHLSQDELYNALVNAMRERDQHAENKNKEVAAHEETKRKHAEHVAVLANGHEEAIRQRDQQLADVTKAHADEVARLEAKHHADRTAALKDQYNSILVPIKQAEHARQLEDLKRKQAEELGTL